MFLSYYHRHIVKNTSEMSLIPWIYRLDSTSLPLGYT